MTNEQYFTAKELKSDIDTLEDVYTEIKMKYKVAFTTLGGQTEHIKSAILWTDFEEFVNEEIIKLKKEFEKL